eukprot:664736-Rhodomonas_salina.1
MFGALNKPAASARRWVRWRGREVCALVQGLSSIVLVNVSGRGWGRGGRSQSLAVVSQLRPVHGHSSVPAR